MIRSTIKPLSVLLCVLASQFNAGAVITTYNNEADFLAQLQPNYHFNDFNDISLGIIHGTLDYSTVQGFEYKISSSGLLYGLGDALAPGDKAISLEVPTKKMVVKFKESHGSQLPTAVGGTFFHTHFDPGVLNPTGEILVTLDDGTIATLASPSFAGFVSDGAGIVSLQIEAVAPLDYEHFPTLDKFYAGTAAVPDGGMTAIFLGAGLAGLYCLRRRTR